MTIYNLNLGIGWASSGVEYAQAYRANIFKKNKQKSKFIFTDLFIENLEPMTKNIGFDDEQIIWMYQYFTDVKIKETTFTVDDLKASFSTQPESENQGLYGITFLFNDGRTKIVAYQDKHCGTGMDRINKVETIVDGNLIQKDYYSYVKTFSEYFKPVDNNSNLYQRRFFNEDGSVAYDELLNGQESLFVMKDRTIYSKESLTVFFLKSLGMTDKDILIMDRSTDNGPSIIKANLKAKIGVVIHAEHFNEPLTSKDTILWNNYYEYQFENANSIDFFIAATEAQKKILEEQFIKYHKGNIKIYAIPVGSIDKLSDSKDRKKHSLITASRLAGEKHLDWLVESVVKAREKISDISLDIYGRGSEMNMLLKLINNNNANEYIHLRGHHDLTDIYKKYEAYVSASTSEGFGLTLLEAIGSGLPMVGFDVRYGNQTFIDENKNGYLIDYQKNDTSQNIEQMSKAIINLISDDKKLKNMKDHSYSIAENFLTEKIQKKWLKLEKEQIDD